VAEQARLLALDGPHVERLVRTAAGPLVDASWATTGDLLEPPQPPGIFAHVLLTLRPWRLTPPRAHPSELPIWKAAAILLSALARRVAFEITLSFVVAYLVTGRAY
jgi:hypothetical protein